jgi:endonuclease/exonuclease/phosphatase family metal-dependent hydrolase
VAETREGGQAVRRGIVVATIVLASAILACGDPALAREKNKKKSVEVANLNLFHGIDCVPVRGDQCRLAERVELLFKHLAAIGCPDIVTLQEIVDRDSVMLLVAGMPVTIGPLTSARALIQAQLESLAEVCGFAYTLLYQPVPGTLFEGSDEELILSRYPILQSDIRLLHSALFSPTIPALQFFARHVLFARIDHPAGPIDVFTTHLASSADFGDNACNSFLDFGNGIMVFVPCPAECDSSQTVRVCQARQVAHFVTERHNVPTPAFITGDFNAPPDSAVYTEFVSRGWIDSHLAAHNPECKPHTGIGCTSGRDAAQGDLERPERNVIERIDYTFIVPPMPGLECHLNRRRSEIFASEPNPFTAEECGALPLPICWASDHGGTMVDLRCQPRLDRSRFVVGDD